MNCIHCSKIWREQSRWTVIVFILIFILSLVVKILDWLTDGKFLWQICHTFAASLVMHETRKQAWLNYNIFLFTRQTFVFQFDGCIQLGTIGWLVGEQRIERYAAHVSTFAHVSDGLKQRHRRGITTNDLAKHDSMHKRIWNDETCIQTENKHHVHFDWFTFMVDKPNAVEDEVYHNFDLLLYSSALFVFCPFILSFLFPSLPPSLSLSLPKRLQKDHAY